MSVTLKNVPSATLKNVPSAVVYYYCAWYVFMRDRCYFIGVFNLPKEYTIQSMVYGFRQGHKS